jgi:bifunctional non-homologous end joining protein LigD
MRPMLASRGRTVPAGAEWLHEVKWDGIRVLVEVGGGRMRIWSRNENDITVTFPELHALSELRHDVVLDGEIVAFLDGIPTFGALADRMHVSRPARALALSKQNPATLLAFDLLALDGSDLTSRPLEERRAALEEVLPPGPSWQVPAAYADGAMLMRATEQQGLEGIVSKRRTSRYVPGRRTPDWLKFPHRPSRSYVVGGWRLETDSATRLGAVLVGEPGPDGLRYRGRVGSGIAGKQGQRLLETLRPLEVDTSPFVDEVPRVDAKGTAWLRPEVVVEIATLGLTPGGRLRQPAFLGVRPDLSVEDVR